MTGERGQATVEVLALVPLLVLVAMTALVVLAAGTARERAANAAQAGAMALIQGTDPEAAARAVLPEQDRSRARISVRGQRVTVRLVPRLPLRGVADRLAATSTADAGRAPTASVTSQPGRSTTGASG